MLKTEPTSSARPPGSVNSAITFSTAVAVSAHEVVEVWSTRFLTPLSLLHVSVPATVGQVARKIAFSLGTSSLHNVPPGKQVP